MAAAEAMLAASTDWTACQKQPFTEAQGEALRAIMLAAERRGEILLGRVFPS